VFRLEEEEKFKKELDSVSISLLFSLSYDPFLAGLEQKLRRLVGIGNWEANQADRTRVPLEQG